jgi:CO dehydrogenase maturation factor
VGRSYAVINQVREEPADVVLNILKEGGLELAGTVPADNTIYEYDLNGQATVNMPKDSPSVRAAFKLFDAIMASAQVEV